jgi:hypothetical protein
LTLKDNYNGTALSRAVKETKNAQVVGMLKKAGAVY